MKRRTLVQLSAALVSPAGRAGEALRIYGDDKYPPVLHLDQGQPAGFLVDILRKAEPLTHDQYLLELMPWNRALELAKRGEAGLIGVSLTRERLQWFDFSEPLYFDDICIVVLEGHEFPYQQLSDLRGKVIGGATGASFGEAADQAVAQGLFRIERDLGAPSRLRKLLAGRMDAAFVGNGLLGFEAVLNAHPDLAAQRQRFRLLPLPLASDPLHLAFPKSQKRQAALQRLSRAVKQLRIRERPFVAR